MPNAPVAAAVDHSPAVSRRALLAGVGAAATVGAVAAGPAAAPAADTPLPTLASRFTAALATYQAADRHRAERETFYLTEHPDPPRVLTAKGPLGKLLRHKGAWWSADDLAALLRDRSLREHRRAARAALPLAQAFEAEVKAFEHACGFAAAEAAHDAAIEALEEVSLAILGTRLRPAGFGGLARRSAAKAGEGNARPDLRLLAQGNARPDPRLLALKARVIKTWSRPDMWSDDPGHADAADRAIAEILDAVIGMDDAA